MAFRRSGHMGAIRLVAFVAVGLFAGCQADGGVEPIDPKTVERPGSFPGTPCRPEGSPDGRCDQDLNGADFVDMVCVNEVCLVDCADGGDFLCGTVVDARLSCSATAGDVCLPKCVDGACSEGLSCFESEGVCLPTGAFPGSPCPADGVCAQDLGGNPDVDLACVAGRCLIPCGAGGTALCQAVNPALACSAAAGEVCVQACVEGACGQGFSCFETEGTCLPTGAFPGSPCRATLPGCDALGDAPMVCLQDQCLVSCAQGGEAVCDAVSDALACSAAAGEVCVRACVEGACDPGYACFETEGTCLPAGAFPGGPCSAQGTCGQDLGGDEAVDMACVADTCLVMCSQGGTGLCSALSDALACSTAAGGFCLPRCVGGGCEAGLSCLEAEGVCLPTGAFPGSPCSDAAPCAQDLGGDEAVDMACVGGKCLVGCAQGGTALCEGVDPGLMCSDAAGAHCLPKCVSGACDAGLSCFATEGACLPTGSFPGSPCPATGGCAQDVGGDAAVDLACVGGACLVQCAEGGTPLCEAVSPILACSAAAGGHCVPKCQGGACGPGLSCLAAEGVCLPIGSFPGGPCAGGTTCAQDLGGNEAADMTCVDGVCVVGCAEGGTPLCEGVSPLLACSAAAGGLCLAKCVEGACDAGFSCLQAEGVCLPTGSFPGSPCRPGPNDRCDQDLGHPDFDLVCTTALGPELCLLGCPPDAGPVGCGDFPGGSEWVCEAGAGLCLSP